MAYITVEKAGLLDIIQDLGRWGYQSQGMSVSGAMDPFSYQIGNLLLGNNRNDPSIEITMAGPALRFSHPTRIVMSGANFFPKLNDQPIPLWQPIEVQSNDVLSFGQPKNGCRCYLAIQGGLQLTKILGSTSTFSKAEIGGIEGRALKKGDSVPYKACEDFISAVQSKSMNHTILTDKVNAVNNTLPKNKLNYSLSYNILKAYLDPLFPTHNVQEEVTLRILLGPNDDYFNEEEISKFLHSTFTVSPMMDRMGLRLLGPNIQHSKNKELLSSAIPFGGIQIPSNGEPILLMADRQTTGGYPLIGTVIYVDLSKAAQLLPQQKVRFQPMMIDDAQDLYSEFKRLLKQLEILLARETSF